MINFSIETLDIVKIFGSNRDTFNLFRTEIVPKQTTKLTIENYEIAVKEIFEIIENLTFDKSISMFIDNRKKQTLNYDMVNAMCSKLVMSIKNPNIKKKIDECCVCYELTDNKTDCNHSLCLCCWGKCKKDENDGYDDCINCPMCREEVEYCL